MNETERLTKLTNSLLTLNNLNTEGMVLEKSNFDINRIIKNTVATFEGTCRDRQISMELVLTRNEMIVTADMGKIQQVLYNLLDNAIKFSHHDSVIKIETTQKHNKIFISVKDNGIGIPKESLKFIWTAFIKQICPAEKIKKAPDSVFPSRKRSSVPTVNISTSSAPRAPEANLPFHSPVWIRMRINTH